MHGVSCYLKGINKYFGNISYSKFLFQSWSLNPASSELYPSPSVIFILNSAGTWVTLQGSALEKHICWGLMFDRGLLGKVKGWL